MAKCPECKKEIPWYKGLGGFNKPIICNNCGLKCMVTPEDYIRWDTISLGVGLLTLILFIFISSNFLLILFLSFIVFCSVYYFFSWRKMKLKIYNEEDVFWLFKHCRWWR